MALIVRVPAIVLPEGLLVVRPVGLLIKVAPCSNVTVVIVQSFMVVIELAGIVTSKLMRVVCPSVPPVPNEPPVISIGNILS
jgi:hypothetical protein